MIKSPDKKLSKVFCMTLLDRETLNWLNFAVTLFLY